MPKFEDSLTKPPGRARIGDRLRRDLESLVVRYVDRLRIDPLFSRAHSLPTALLEDHAMSFVSDLFQSLVVLENAEELDAVDESELLGDGNKIQRLVAELAPAHHEPPHRGHSALFQTASGRRCGAAR